MQVLGCFPPPLLTSSGAGLTQRLGFGLNPADRSAVCTWLRACRVADRNVVLGAQARKGLYLPWAGMREEPPTLLAIGAASAVSQALAVQAAVGMRDSGCAVTLRVPHSAINVTIRAAYHHDTGRSAVSTTLVFGPS